MSKIRVLCWFDSPTVATGFAQVSKNILKELYQTGKYEFDIIGINYMDDGYDKEKYPYNIIPAIDMKEILAGKRADIYGRDKLIKTLLWFNNAMQKEWDILFTIQDHFVAEDGGFAKTISAIKTIMKDQEMALQLQGQTIKFPRRVEPFRWVGYWPVDSALRGNWVVDAIQQADYPVFYTDYGRKQAAYHADELSSSRIIFHGVNTDDFKPVSRQEKKRFRQEYFGDFLEQDSYLVTNISRNQWRKDPQRTLQIFAEFQKKVPEAKLYMHMKTEDVGGNIDEYARDLGLKKGEDYLVLDAFNPNTGVDLKTLNLIYNTSDVLLTTTLGEGWGFILTESMAAKKVVVAPFNTSIPEVFGIDNPEDLTGRGVAYKSGSTKSEWVSLGPIDKERRRPLGNIEDAVDKLLWVYENKDKAREVAERGHQWVQGLSWDNIAKEWDEVLTEAYEDRKRAIIEHEK